jgi:putative GTP pyrophosphokinase
MKENIEIRRKFTDLLPLYERLGKNVIEALETFLNEHIIGFLAISTRIKSLDSFVEKIERKNYSDPFEDIEDICGIRVICFYQSDIEKICQIIEREFDIQENEDKEQLLNDDQFGYRSYHYVGKIKEKWLEAPKKAHHRAN